ncbi:ABC transporter permease [Desulfovibrio sp. Fe33]|uniref:ABC transporter permease n=1 Tax=Desulfovibrio sp. Fe33 TaxID=3020842 RepID=UPI00234D0FD4|nr:iron ABC transporter permease [Desulfovibrio sp. Fe33]
MNKFMPWGALTLLSCLFLAVFLLLPIFKVILASLQNADGALTLEGFKIFFTEGDYLQGLFNSLFLAAAVTVVTVLIGVPLAYVTVYYDFPFKSLLSILPITVVIIPELITTQSWLLVFGYNGFVTQMLLELGIRAPRFYGWTGLIFVMAITYYVHVYMASLAALRSFDVQLEEAAQSLGRSPISARIRTMVPLMAPAILSSALVVFTLVLGNFSIAIILGPSVPLLSVMTYNSFLSEVGLNPLMQSALATISIVLVGLILFVQKRFVGKSRFEMRQGRSMKALPIKGAWGVAAYVAVLALLAVTLLPLGLVLAGSITDSTGPVMHWGHFTLKHFANVADYGVEIIVNSISYAFSATVLGVVFGTTASYLIIKKKNALTEALDFMVMLPMAIFGTVLGIALSQTFNAGLIPLTGTPIIMVLALTLRRLPFSVRNASANLFNIPDSIEEAAISLGTSPMKSFRKVVAPLMAPGITSAAVLMWAMTMAELASTLLLYHPSQETLPIKIYNLIDSDLMAQASAYGVVMIVLILTPIFLVTKFTKVELFK